MGQNATIYETTMLNQQSIKQTNISKHSQNNNSLINQKSNMPEQSEQKAYPPYHESRIPNQSKRLNIQHQSNII